jgi:hypothetical protein
VIAPPQATPQPTCASTRTKRLPSHLDDYHLFTTVAAETRLPQAHPYHMVGGTDVDLAIQDEECMAHLCHFVMVHTATSLESAS